MEGANVGVRMKLTGSGNTGNRVQGIMKSSKVKPCRLDCCTTTTTSAKL